MARTIKSGLDYFYFDVDFFSDTKIRRIKMDCGVASISALIYLLCELYRNGYFILVDDEIIFSISDKIGISEATVSEMIDKAIQIDFFSRAMFDKYRILTSVNIQRRFLDIVRDKRLKKKDIKPEYSLLVTANESTNNYANSVVSDDDKLSNINVAEKSKTNADKLRVLHSTDTIIPTLDEVKEYCVKRGNLVDYQKFFDYYTESNWIDGDGNPVLNWKQKIIIWESNKHEKVGVNGEHFGNVTPASDGGEGGVNGNEKPKYGAVYA